MVDIFKMGSLFLDQLISYIILTQISEVFTCTLYFWINNFLHNIESDLTGFQSGAISEMGRCSGYIAWQEKPSSIEQLVHIKNPTKFEYIYILNILESINGFN